MKRMMNWIGLAIGFYAVAPIYAAIFSQPVDWGPPFFMSFGAGMALLLHREGKP